MTTDLIPKRIFFTKGVGRHKEKLHSFEMALRDAGIEKCNIVSVSSIFPPKCKIVPKPVGLSDINAGEVIFTVMARESSNEPNRLLCASIGLAVPSDREHYGYLSEHHGFGETDQKAGDYSEDLAASMLASTLGVPFDSDSSYDERKETWKISDKIVKTSNYTQSAIVDKTGLWTTVIAVAVFLLGEGSPITKHPHAQEAEISQNVIPLDTNNKPADNAGKPADNNAAYITPASQQ